MKKKTIGKEYIFTALILFVVLAVTMVLDSQLPGYHIVIKVIKKASVYSLVAVSMNLLNGFTGLFSLGQAGFMLLGAYSYAVLCIPVAKRAGVYQYFDGGIVKFSLPEIFASFLGDKVGSAVGMILALLVGGLIAAFFAYLIGLPVLRLKSDYLAIATLGFAEIMRTIIQWNAIGPLTNASNLLKGYPDFSSATAYLLLIGVFIACVVLLVNSTYGRAFKAIRDDEVAAEAMGINLAKHKMLSFVTSSFFAGVSGATMAMVLSIAQANNYKVAMTYEILLMVVLGGIGNIRGFLKQDMDMPAFWAYLKETLAGSGMVFDALTPQELGEVEKRKAEKYDTWEWNYGRSPKFDMTGKRYWVGGCLEVGVSVAHGVITDVRFHGDFLAVCSMEPLVEALCGVPFRREDVRHVLDSQPMSELFGGITEEQVLDTMFGS